MTPGELRDAVEAMYNSPEHTERRKNWQRFLKEFSGKWWDESKLAPEDSKIFCNYIFSTIETVAPLLTDNRPIWNVIPRRYYFQRLADVYNDGLKFVWETSRMDEKLLDNVYDMLIHGTGLFKVYFDPDAENGLGDVALDVVDPFEFVISPGSDDLWNASWCGMRKAYTVADVKRMYPKMAAALTAENESVPLEGKKDRLGTNDLIGDYILLYEIWLRDDATENAIEKEYSGKDEAGNDIYLDKKVKKAKYPNGRLLTFTDGTLRVLSDRPSPFKHGRPPYVAIYDYKMPHQFWGQGEPDQIENLNREFNTQLQQIVEHARKYTKINAILDEGAEIDSEVLKAAMRTGDQVMVSKGGFSKDVVHYLQVPDLPTVITQIMSTLPQLLEEVSGVTDISKGVVGKKQRQTATEMSMLLESSYTRVRQRVRNLEYGLKRIATLVIELMMQFYTEPRDFYTRTDDEVTYGVISNSAEFAKSAMKPADRGSLQDSDMTEEALRDAEDYAKLIEAIGDEEEVFFDFGVDIQTNSTLPLDRQSLANLMLRLADMKVVDAQAVLETLRIPGTQEILARLQKQKDAELAAKAGQGSGDAPLTPQGEAGKSEIEGLMAKMNGQGE